MGISPGVAIGAGIGALAVGAGSGIGLTKWNDAIRDANPQGSAADLPMTLTSVGAGVLGLGLGIGAMFAARGGAPVGVTTALVASGAGLVLGSIGGGIATSVRHGVGVDTKVGSIFGSYDQGFIQGDGVLDTRESWLHVSEAYRSTSSSTDRNDDGDTWDYGETTHTWYEITRFTRDADVNDDQYVTRGEARDLVASYDRNGDGRLIGDEKSSFERFYGERYAGTTYS